MGTSRGSDVFGRVAFNSYYRPPGVPGPINITSSDTTSFPYGAIAPYNPMTMTIPGTGTPAGFGDWWQNNQASPPMDPGVPIPWTADFTSYPPAPTATVIYEPDVTNNPFHGYESIQIPQPVPVRRHGVQLHDHHLPSGVAAMPIDQNTLTVGEMVGASPPPGPPAYTPPTAPYFLPDLRFARQPQDAVRTP